MKTLFPSLPENAQLGDTLKAFPPGAAQMMQLADVILNGPSDLSVGEREMIAAYVSSLNACAFCTGSHSFIARAHGIDIDLINALLADPDTAEIDAKLRPLLAYAKKLTETPSKMTEADAKAAYDAGWSEEVLYQVVQITAFFNMMNRIVEGTGVAEYAIDPEQATDAQMATRRSRTYGDFARDLGVADG